MRSRFVFLALLLATGLYAQEPILTGRVSARIAELERSGTRFEPVQLFQRLAPTEATDLLWRSACRQAEVLRYDVAAAQALLRTRYPFITLQLPTGTDTLLLDLQQADVVAEETFVRLASTGALTPTEPGLHYRGTVRGVHGSIVAISVFPEDLMGLIADRADERVIGRFDDAPTGLHVMYQEGDLLATPEMACGTEGLPPVKKRKTPKGGGSAKSIRCVKWYWEVAYDIFQNKGSVINATNYVTGLFNQSAILFDNDGVDVQLQEVFVWNTPSPYNGASSGSRLSQFGTTRTSFNGDLAHLLDYGGYGGVAWLSSLCSSTSQRMAYSGIHGSFNNVPTYSWSVMVVTHEAGHNLGSQHTHACVWNGNNTALDGCGPAAGYSGGSCATGPIPPAGTGGTIMSYCHLLSTGINLANGFGPQPAAVILDEVNGSTCLTACGSSCDAPGGRLVTQLNPSSCTLSWNNIGVPSYTVQWKAQNASVWNTVSGITVTTLALTGLVPSTAYAFQVASNCTTDTSLFSPSVVFTTPAPCPDAMEPNELVGTAAPVILPASIDALIATATDQDHYGITTVSPNTLSLQLSNLGGNYDLYLLNTVGTVLASSTQLGTTSEYLTYNAVAGNYVIRVSGNGSFHALQCYRLAVSSYNSPCMATGLTATSITSYSAYLSWTPSFTANLFDLQWKAAAAGTWNTVTGLTSPNHVLTGLVANTDYQYRVKPNCAGSQAYYSEVTNFTTTGSPCVGPPPTTVALKVFLEGPFTTGTGWMIDSLRFRAYLPIAEPYSALGLPVTGPTAIAPALLDITGANALVDWVVVELRSASDSALVQVRRAALLQRDGDIVDLDGTSPVGFCMPADNYFLAVRHRNHLGVMTSVPVALSSTALTVDLTSTGLATHGTDARKPIGSVMVLWAGNVSGDDQLKYTGSTNDRDLILVSIGGIVPTNTTTGYHLADVNLNGIVKYTGSGNDRDHILVNIGGVIPTNTRIEQLP